MPDNDTITNVRLESIKQLALTRLVTKNGVGNGLLILLEQRIVALG